MTDKQHTIKEAVTISGVGLHTGIMVNMTLRPAPENHGIKFKRIDLEGQPTIDADVDNVVDTSRGTTLAVGNVKVHTVEHTMAALAGMSIDNVLVELDAPEPPIMDGSAKCFVEAIQKAGIEKQNADREYFVVEQNIQYSDPQKQIDMAALPLNGYRMTVMVDYNSPVLGSQHATILDMNDFAKEIAPCRTFCFLHELEALLKAGLIKGGDVNNAIVVVDRQVTEEELEHLAKLFNKPKVSVSQGILNNIKLHYNNEPARHKLLDLIGDLALVGAPLKAQILAARPGHTANIAFAKKIKAAFRAKKITKQYQSNNTNSSVVFDIKAIQKILPHRYPFLLVDKVTYFDDKRIVGVKNVTINEPFFAGHFEGNPIMPGVLQLEAMAQVGGILLLNTVENPNDVWVYFLAIDNARFKKPVIPGDQIVFELEMVSLKRGICRMNGKATVDGKLVSEAELVASIIPKNKA
ncbi:MAG: bifunctional UDP-3-O-[3-hydroxymyristoyl] N-acetylglucosamine deacetylase/3-hydroxyacyl-ACP dehydratase [Bacteroidia bacterium]|nr:bifunctional UDP-3-O-[3-hydroxymyristoyl] N-acetylglucosamine deacetylase/3-hydroxyacyl-ACP dehydratase [Bacteroidia bacterium]MDW8301110.1 bifunctional UDP-3-O-[3-hydroxymyristoyl] N-acetylglucosamine deacetylase/3-hydroxyacyl-ACP dehydratase [Bacteroidia bacterium]